MSVHSRKSLCTIFVCACRCSGQLVSSSNSPPTSVRSTFPRIVSPWPKCPGGIYYGIDYGIWIWIWTIMEFGSGINLCFSSSSPNDHWCSPCNNSSPSRDLSARAKPSEWQMATASAFLSSTRTVVSCTNYNSNAAPTFCLGHRASFENRGDILSVSRRWYFFFDDQAYTLHRCSRNHRDRACTSLWPPCCMPLQPSTNSKYAKILFFSPNWPNWSGLFR